MEATFEKMAVVIVDMQESFVSRVWEDEKESVIGHQVMLIRACAERDIPVVILEYTGDGETIRVLMTEIEKVPTTRKVVKYSNCGFYLTNLNTILVELGVRILVFTGINASFCVASTANSALRLGYKIATSEDLIADGRSHALGKSREWYRRNGLFFESRHALTKALAKT